MITRFFLGNKQNKIFKADKGLKGHIFKKINVLIGITCNSLKIIKCIKTLKTLNTINSII